MSTRLAFTTLDVFTTQPFSGNPLAIVRVPKELSTKLSQAQKQTIAREFNYSETVFLHESASQDGPVTIDIFTTTEELPFAGHPTVGSGWHLLSANSETSTAVLKTKAGLIPVSWAGSGHSRVQLRVPTDFKIHPSYAPPGLKARQPRLTGADYTHGLDGAEAVASIVKGMTFVLAQLASEDALARMQLVPETLAVPGLGAWAGFCGLYAFFERADGVVRTRMFADGFEDPATGSAASTLAGWLAKQRGPGTHSVSIVQGVEMGRRSEIEVVVEVDDKGEIETITLSGSAVQIMEGTVSIPPQ